MKFTAEDVQRIAHLARLEVPDAKAAAFAPQLDKVVEYMATLNELDTTDVEPLYGPVDKTTVLRADESRKEIAREDILANAPESDGAFFIVPKIV